MELGSSIEEDQCLLVQWAEEKMLLACIMSDLLGSAQQVATLRFPAHLAKYAYKLVASDLVLCLS